MDRTERLYLRCTPEEKERLLNGAKLAGMTLTAYLLFQAGVQAGYEITDKAISSLNNKKKS